MSLIAGNLGVVQRLLDGNQMKWGVCAGVAAHLYGDRRPIQDVDILVTTGKLPEVVKLGERSLRLESQNANDLTALKSLEVRMPDQSPLLSSASE